MRLNTLLNKLNIPQIVINNHKINSLEDNSLDCNLNDVFFVIPSLTNDNNKFIEEAITNGAKTIVYENIINNKYSNINYIKVDDVKKTIALSAKLFYKDITKKIKLIGVTGTNGKTTITNLIHDYLCYEGHEVMMIGTNGIFFKKEHYNTNNTTPNLLLMTKVIKQALRKGLEYVVIEVSSIGIREQRVMYFDFDIIILSNVTHDHLDYHKTMIDYKFSKGIIISNMKYKKNKYVILNKDLDNFDFYNKLSEANVVTYSIVNQSDYQGVNVNKNINETSFRLLFNHNKYYFKTSLIGGFNVYNILSALACINKLGFSINRFSDFLKLYVNVEGRMDLIKYKDKTVVIDFAHTPDSVENALKTLKEYSNRKLTVIIGAGGNRDKIKRSIIGEITCKYADKIIFTNDNPRDEIPTQIIDDITKEIKEYKYEIILDRKEAIYKALNDSIKDEIIAILGKGSENYQIIMGIKHPFSDKQTVKNYIKEHKNE
ncbi:MAG: UDP-N-acetylmuramoyl-L-alanyl-D-glutamate--2,6-diaminopimelate ligase [bacterium]